MSDDEPKTILIVEDNELNMRLFSDILEASGYRTLHSKDGSDAVALAEQHRPDLILMDIRLPDISGLDIAATLKKSPRLRHIPVVAVTASALKGEEERLYAAGCDGFIAKPIVLEPFLESISKFLAKAQNANAPDGAGA